MFTLTIDDNEYYDYSKEEFISVKGQTLQLEHSLVSISKWESKWKKAFLGKNEKTNEEIIDYIRCMTITKNVDPIVYNFLTSEQVESITKYIEDPMTATWFNDDKKKSKGGGNSETVTSELIYYWMITCQIPVEFQRWHLNRLLTLIRICEMKNTPPKKMSKRDLMNRNRSLNEQRKKALGTRG